MLVTNVIASFIYLLYTCIYRAVINFSEAAKWFVIVLKVAVNKSRGATYVKWCFMPPHYSYSTMEEQNIQTKLSAK